MLVIFGGIIFQIPNELLGDKKKDHCIYTWGLRIVHGFERGLVRHGGGGVRDLNDVIQNFF